VMHIRIDRAFLAVAFLSVLAIVAAWPTPAVAQGRIRADFNGDGADDLAVGVPGEKSGSGGVNVIYGSGQGLTATGNQFLRQGMTGVPESLEVEDNCGAALAAGDFNGDGIADLAMGCPGEDFSGHANLGGVSIFYGSRTGLVTTGSQFFAFVDLAVGEISSDDKCATSLAAGDFNGDGYVDLAMGCPGRDVGVTLEGGGALDAGRVIVLYGSGSGLTATGRQSFTQATAGVPDTIEQGDNCGASVAAGDFNHDGFSDLAWGCPGEDVSGSQDVGGVNIVYGSAGGLTGTGAQFFSFTDVVSGEVSFQDKCGSALATGDFNGDRFEDLAVGCPGRDIGGTVESSPSVINAGMVVVLFGSATRLSQTGRQSFTQATPGILDAAEANDNCGASVASGDFNRDAIADLVMGCPGEDVPGNTDMGAVNIIFGSPSGLTTVGDQFFSFNSLASFADRCATAVATGDFNGDGVDDLAVGCPGHDDLVIGEGVFGNFDVGQVVILFSSGTSLTTAGSQTITQNSTGIAGDEQDSDALGFALAGSGGFAGPGLTGSWRGVEQTCHETGGGQQCRLKGTFVVVNPGTQTAAPTRLRFYLSADRTLDAGDMLLGEVSVGTLKPSESKPRQLNVQLPSGVSASGRFVIAFADADNVVAETNEENNIVVFGPIE